MEYFTSFFQNIKDKLTNPFFGTLIIVLILHHPQFWYSLFNFDKGVNLRQKVEYLSKLGAKEFTSEAIIYDILCTLFFVFVGYLIVVGTRSLSLWIEYRIMPIITKIIASENLVMREEYNEVVKDRNEYSEKYEEQRNAVRIMSKDFDELSSDANNKISLINNLQSQITTLNNSLSLEKSNSNKWKMDAESSERIVQDLRASNESLSDINDRLKSINENFLEFFFGNLDANVDPVVLVQLALLKIRELRTENLWQTFLTAAHEITNDNIIDIDAISLMVERKLVVTDNEDENTVKLSIMGGFLWKNRENLSEDTPYN
ncbi:hypothetical protein ASG38_07475 [Flavobacterium sp. Leaf359]|uniref:hypothetical protein n=1 Tax=Flavobacterium sp. Leaf359 TaxID=1736351 RepID=UPI0007016222|nr:hypothetical protein [Flavobacterium sp. Leaf359]KQS47289.1 hypothetical protein ASG38_07475 [Flavobacterium sp. Leaf359]